MIESEIPDFIKGRLNQKTFKDVDKGRLQNLQIHNFEERYSSPRTHISSSSLLTHYKNSNQVLGANPSFPPVQMNQTSQDTFYNPHSSHTQRMGSPKNFGNHLESTDCQSIEDDMFNFTTDISLTRLNTGYKANKRISKGKQALLGHVNLSKPKKNLMDDYRTVMDRIKNAEFNQKEEEGNIQSSQPNFHKFGLTDSGSSLKGFITNKQSTLNQKITKLAEQKMSGRRIKMRNTTSNYKESFTTKFNKEQDPQFVVSNGFSENTEIDSKGNIAQHEPIWFGGTGQNKNLMLIEMGGVDHNSIEIAKGAQKAVPSNNKKAMSKTVGGPFQHRQQDHNIQSKAEFNKEQKKNILDNIKSSILTKDQLGMEEMEEMTAKRKSLNNLKISQRRFCKTAKPINMLNTKEEIINKLMHEVHESDLTLQQIKKPRLKNLEEMQEDPLILFNGEEIDDDKNKNVWSYNCVVPEGLVVAGKDHNEYYKLAPPSNMNRHGQPTISMTDLIKNGARENLDTRILFEEEQNLKKSESENSIPTESLHEFTGIWGANPYPFDPRYPKDFKYKDPRPSGKHHRYRTEGGERLMTNPSEDFTSESELMNLSKDKTNQTKDLIDMSLRSEQEEQEEKEEEESEDSMEYSPNKVFFF